MLEEVITGESIFVKRVQMKKKSAKKEKRGGRMLRKVLQKAWRERGEGGREGEGGEAKNREGVLLMISPPAVGLGRSEGGRGGEVREEQWQRKQNGL